MSQDLDFFVPEEKTFGELFAPYTHPEGQSSQKAVILSGYPYDQGTRRNGGRVGGAVAPSVFRNTLKERQLYLHKKLPLYDSGNIEPEQQLQSALVDQSKKHKQILGSFPKGLLISVGGSNDQSFPNVEALMETYPESRLGVINLDSHFDVRPLKQGKAHSGSPFRLMLQHPLFHKNKSRFVEFAVKGATCSNQHFQFLKQNNAQVYWMQKDIRHFKTTSQSKYYTQGGQLFEKIIREFEQQCDIIFVSFDVDSINSKYMPGVSAPSVIGGLTSEEALEIAEVAGSSPKIKLVDFSEFNPAVQSTLSSRLLVQLVYGVVSAFSERSE